MNGWAARSLLLLSMFAMLACSREARGPQSAASPAATADSTACARICRASSACGDPPAACAARCNEWLVRRSRPGIAASTAACAVPRIDDACGSDEASAAATALVACVDDAGRRALRNDNSTLLVAARAICTRGARCGGASAKDASVCVDRIAGSSPPPRGLGIFGAVKPELVEEFADCMESSACSAGGAVCFDAMLGELSPAGEQGPSAPKAPPIEGGTKI